ncbi:MAG: hypothetical protein M3437_17930 [Chloroflexota bacterium]|nr:hypothetical protein [Chloroflexota bacterium]MDQ5867484.1 hypothetical protein [Chloroflexota bacterium]
MIYPRKVLACLILIAGITGSMAACGTQDYPTPAAGTPMPQVQPSITAQPTKTLRATPTALPAESSPSAEVAAPNPGDGTNHDVLFSIPVGEQKEGLQYRGDNIEGMQRSGPAAFSVAPDGSFWIADTAGLRVLQYSAGGEWLQTVDMATQPRSLTDIEATANEIYVLDAFPTPPLVIRISPSGQVKGQYELPEEFRLEKLLTGIGLGEGGELLVEKDGGAEVFRLLDDQGRIAPTRLEGYTYKGTTYKAKSAGIQAEDNRVGHLTIGDRQVEVRTEHFLGGLRILGFGPEGSVFVKLEEVVVEIIEGQVPVDQTVRMYSADGRLLGMARMPLVRQHTYITQPVVVGPKGEAYAMLTQPDHVEILRLGFAASLDSILAAPATPIP